MAHFFGGWVYLLHIETQKGHYYKIGKASSLDDRIKQIGLVVPFDVDVVAVCPVVDETSTESEAWWHERFADKRVRGEWFDLSEEDVSEFRDHARTSVWDAAMYGYITGKEHPFVGIEMTRRPSLLDISLNGNNFWSDGTQLKFDPPGVAVIVDKDGLISSRRQMEWLIDGLQATLHLYTDEDIEKHNSMVQRHNEAQERSDGKDKAE